MPVACPFFMPMGKIAGGSWLHAARLPLGDGWSGHCTAPGHDGEIPREDELRELCNLGYAEGCRRLPQERPWDSIRFGARTLDDGVDSANSGRIQLRYVCERQHRPADHGTLTFDVARACCEQPHQDSRLQRMAECFLTSYMEKRKAGKATPAAS
jgi:hypothetical protein